MDARAFAAATRRTYLRESRLNGGDATFVLGATLIVILLLAMSSSIGWLRTLFA
jgi:energy-coupling factor transporter transmembrane protein EcfT